MKDKVLILASVASMIDQFNRPNINILLSMGYEVHVACNFEKGSTCTDEKIKQLKAELKELDVKYFQIDFTRSVFNLFQDFKSYKQVKNLMKKNNYKFIHCHSPIGGVIGRLSCKATKTKCIYTAHGFHFYKGAPLKNWLIFYPIEKLLSKYTDILITINKEDYNRAKDKFKMKKLEYVPGVGIDENKFQLKCFDREKYRSNLGFTKNDFVICSVGELNKNKNHDVIIKALSKIDKPNVKYIIVGIGSLEEYLIELSKRLGISKNVFLLGYRKDVPEILYSSDLFIFPSKREGLPVSVMEAIMSDVVCAVSKIRGNVDLINDGINGYVFKYHDLNRIEEIINKVINMTKENKNKLVKNNDSLKNEISLNQVSKKYKSIYDLINKENIN